jgi:hypothetical protein
MHGRTGNWHENGNRSNLKGGKRADMNLVPHDAARLGAYPLR